MKAEFVIHSLRGSDPSDSSCLPFNTIADDIKLIKVEVLEFDHHERDFESQNVSKILTIETSQSSTWKMNEVMVDLVDEVEIIVDQLTRGSKKLDIVSIVGMPGLGKTTLAKKVYNNPKVRCHFHTFAWCCVSEVYNRKTLLLGILVCIAPDLSVQYDAKNEDDLA
ncbi:hypothetical protein ACH5RR_021282 [Cinchona calisaya]|uniref:NB-ARC domain-containing protein n=1 Tax=Cinchona calisaya TaxID=153742 RepID=A0ABD2ZI41_9GENT